MRKSYLFNFQRDCALTQGYANDCRDSIGGAKFFHVIEFPNVTAVTITSGVITAITKASTKRFWKYVPAKETSYAKETLTASVQNGTAYWAQELYMALNKMQTNTRNELLLLAQNLLLVVVTDGNGKHWLYGYKNGLDATAGEAGTGTGPGDRNGYGVTLTGSEPVLAIEVGDTAYGTLETPGA